MPKQPDLLHEVRSDVKQIIVQITRVVTILEDIPNMKASITKLEAWKENMSGRIWGLSFLGGGFGTLIGGSVKHIFFN